LGECAEEVIALVLEKNADYGDAWRIFGVVGVLVRICDKVLRLENMMGNGGGRIGGQVGLVADERWVDTLRDIAGYALLGLLLVEAETEAENEAVGWGE
jgi:hypothetical protein